MVGRFVKGEVYSFVYNGGSRKGEPRVVLVTNIDAGASMISGVDLTGPKGDKFRNFTLRLVKDVDTVDYTVVDLTALPKSFNAKDLVAGYEKEGKVAVEYDGKVYVADAPVAKPKRRFKSSGLAVTISIDDVEYHIYPTGLIVRASTPTSVVKELTDEEFVRVVVGK